MALISYIDYTLVPNASLTGVNWTAGLPVTNLAPYDLGQPARSTTTDASISVDLGSSKQVGIFAVPKHSLSYSATWRIRASDNVLLLTAPALVPTNEIIYDSSSGINSSTISTTTIDILSPPSSIYVQDNLYFNIGDQLDIYDGVNYLKVSVTSFDNLSKELGISVLDNSVGAYTGSMWVVSKTAIKDLIWPVSSGFGSNVWGQFVWDGRIDIISDSLSRPPALKVLENDISARYFVIEVEDTGNTESYIDLHKLVIGPAWRTSTDIKLGYTISYEDKSKVSRSRGGQAYINIQPQYRKFSVNFEGLPRRETYNNLLEMDKLLGTGNPILLCLAPEDLANLGNKSVYGNQAALKPSKERLKNFVGKSLIIEEWI